MTEKTDFEAQAEALSAAAIDRAANILGGIDQVYTRQLGDALLAVLRRTEPDSSHLISALAMVFTTTMHRAGEEQRQEAMQDLVALIRLLFNHIDEQKEIASGNNQASTSD